LSTSSFPPDRLSRELIATVHEPLVLLDAELRVVTASTAFVLEFGSASEEVIGHSIYTIGNGAWDSEALRELLERVSPLEEEVAGRVVAIGTGASERAWRLNVRPIRTGGNRLEFLLVACEPARAAARGDLGTAELSRLALEHASALVAIYRPDGACLYVAGGSQAALGYTPDEWLALSPCSLLHPADLEAHRATLSPHAPERLPGLLTVRIRRAGGEYASMEIGIRVVEHAGEGQLVHVTAHDITQQRRAEDALRWLSRQTRLILDSVGEGIFGVDTRGAVTFVNPVAARMLGCEVPDLMGTAYRDFFLTEEGDPDDEVAATLGDGRTRTRDARVLRRRDGDGVSVEVTCTAARMHGDVVGAVVTFRDLARRRRVEEAEQHAQWLNGVAQTALALRHEINNPLTTLLAEASLLELGGNSAEEEREMIASINAEARRIRDIVRRLTERQDHPTVRSDSGGSMLDLSEE
jgi:PAS domain S-box-containing protein